MRIRHLYSVFFLSLFLLAASGLMAQEQRDTIVVNNDTANTSGKNLLALDTAIPKKFNPRKATIRSAIIPGWGQAYNKKYWKIPIVYAALGTAVYVFFDNIKTYKNLRKAVSYRSDTIDTNDDLIEPDLIPFSTEELRFYRNAYRQNIDYSVLAFLVIWGLNVVDATVDAHLKAFDVSSDISMKIRPGFNYSTQSPGISFVFFFRDKKSR